MSRAHRGLLPQTLSQNYMQIIRRMRRYKNIPKKDGTLKSHAMAYSQSLVYIYLKAKPKPKAVKEKVKVGRPEASDRTS